MCEKILSNLQFGIIIYQKFKKSTENRLEIAKQANNTCSSNYISINYQTIYIIY
jgi:hypothetical protein